MRLLARNINVLSSFSKFLFSFLSFGVSTFNSRSVVLIWSEISLGFDVRRAPRRWPMLPMPLPLLKAGEEMLEKSWSLGDSQGRVVQEMEDFHIFSYGFLEFP